MEVYLHYINYYQMICSLPSVLWCCWLGGRKSIRPVKKWVVGCCSGYLSGWDVDLHIIQLMPLPPIISHFIKIQNGSAFLVLSYSGCPGKSPLNECLVSL